LDRNFIEGKRLKILIYEIVVVSSIGLLEWSNIKSSLPAKLQEKLNAGNYSQQNDELSA
jgi:hypothetical protein